MLSAGPTVQYSPPPPTPNAHKGHLCSIRGVETKKEMTKKSIWRPYPLATLEGFMRPIETLIVAFRGLRLPCSSSCGGLGGPFVQLPSVGKNCAFLLCYFTFSPPPPPPTYYCLKTFSVFHLGIYNGTRGGNIIMPVVPNNFSRF